MFKPPPYAFTHLLIICMPPDINIMSVNSRLLWRAHPFTILVPEPILMTIKSYNIKPRYLIKEVIKYIWLHIGSHE